MGQLPAQGGLGGPPKPLQLCLARLLWLPSAEVPLHPVPPRAAPRAMSCALPSLRSTHTLVMRQGQ